MNYLVTSEAAAHRSHPEGALIARMIPPSARTTCSRVHRQRTTPAWSPSPRAPLGSGRSPGRWLPNPCVHKSAGQPHAAIGAVNRGETVAIPCGDIGGTGSSTPARQPSLIAAMAGAVSSRTSSARRP